MNILWLTELVFFKKINDFLGWNVVLVFDSGGNDLSIFLRSNDSDLDVLHDEIKLNNTVAFE